MSESSTEAVIRAIGWLGFYMCIYHFLEWWGVGLVFFPMLAVPRWWFIKP